MVTGPRNRLSSEALGAPLSEVGALYVRGLTQSLRAVRGSGVRSVWCSCRERGAPSSRPAPHYCPCLPTLQPPALLHPCLPLLPLWQHRPRLVAAGAAHVPQHKVDLVLVQRHLCEALRQLRLEGLQRSVPAAGSRAEGGGADSGALWAGPCLGTAGGALAARCSSWTAAAGAADVAVRAD